MSADEHPFPPAEPETWRKAAEKALKGAPLDRLVRQTLDGYALQPIYHPADVRSLAHLGSQPGQSPYVRGIARPDSGPWVLRADPDACLPEAWNAIAIEEVAGGASALGLSPDRAATIGLDPDAEGAAELVGQGGVSVATARDLRRALEGIDLEQTPVTLGASPSPVLAALCLASRRTTPRAGALGVDPLGCIAGAGRIPAPLEQLYRAMADAVTWTAEHAPGLQVVTVHGHPYHDGGASPSQELGFALATAAEYLRRLVEHGLEPDVAARSIGLSLSVGSRCFTEVAKLRAARLLWDRIAAAFGCGAAARAARIHAAGSGWTSSARDPWVNMLRATVQCIAAVVGGAQSVSSLPFDRQLGASTAFSRRILRNTQLILREESHLAGVTDPAGGSWSVEAMTDQLGRAAWKLLVGVEERGGMGLALMEGSPQREVAELAQRRLAEVARRREPFVGVTSYADVQERPLQREARAPVARTTIDKGAPPAAGTGFQALLDAAAAGATLGQLTRAVASGEASRAMEAIPARRGMEAFERLRDRADAFKAREGRLPRCGLVSLGPRSEHRARAEWTAGALAAGGFEVVEGEGEVEVEVEVLVACGKDDRYPQEVPKLKARADAAGVPLVVAGRPPDDAAWAEGVLRLNVKTDLVQLLEQLHAPEEVRP